MALRQINLITSQKLEQLYANSSLKQVEKLRANVGFAISTLETFLPSEEVLYFINTLQDIDSIASTFAGNETTLSTDLDHDYGNFLKLARSIKFQWGPWTSLHDASAFSPQLWAVNALITNTTQKQISTVLEIGAGTCALGYHLKCIYPDINIILSDISLESLSFGVLLHNGHKLVLPVRVGFDSNPSGIKWYNIQVPAITSGVSFCSQSIPAINTVSDVNVVIAVNSLSLFSNPKTAVETLCQLINPLGLFVWVDLFSWRVETPVARRLAGPTEMLKILEANSLAILNWVSGIPYIEDWGYERTYQWTSHLVVARKL